MSKARKVFAVAVLVALAWAVAPMAEAQAPIRIGATLSQTGGRRYSQVGRTTWPFVRPYSFDVII